MPTLRTIGYQVNRGGPLPLYEQLKRALSNMVASEILNVGDQLPTIAELCARFGVSHITVSKALDDLARQGVVERIQGKGTFVTGHRIERRLTNLISFTREMERQGLKVRSQILSTEEIPGDSPQSIAFHRAPEVPKRYIRIARLRFVDDVPACMTTSIFPEPIGRRLLQLPLENASFYNLIEERLGLRLYREERWITPTLAGGRIARFLGLRRGAPIFSLEGMTYLEGDIPIEATESFFRGDKFRFFANVYRFVGGGREKKTQHTLIGASNSQDKGYG